MPPNANAEDSENDQTSQARSVRFILRNRAGKAGWERRFYNIPEERDVELQRFGDSLVPDLLTGRYDMGFEQFCGRAASIRVPDCDESPTRTLLRSYRPGIRVPDRTPKLENAGRFHFIEYVAPLYPRPAQLAHVESKITLELLIDQETGKVMKAQV